jgi:hypothetical protein
MSKPYYSFCIFCGHKTMIKGKAHQCSATKIADWLEQELLAEGHTKSEITRCLVMMGPSAVLHRLNLHKKYRDQHE